MLVKNFAHEYDVSKRRTYKSFRNDKEIFLDFDLNQDISMNTISYYFSVLSGE